MKTGNWRVSSTSTSSSALNTTRSVEVVSAPVKDSTAFAAKQFTPADIVLTMKSLKSISFPYNSDKMQRRRSNLNENRGQSKTSSEK